MICKRYNTSSHYVLFQTENGLKYYRKDISKLSCTISLNLNKY